MSLTNFYEKNEGHAQEIVDFAYEKASEYILEKRHLNLYDKEAFYILRVIYERALAYWEEGKNAAACDNLKMAKMLCGDEGLSFAFDMHIWALSNSYTFEQFVDEFVDDFSLNHTDFFVTKFKEQKLKHIGVK